MLQQILRDMYVDPEILAELPEEQKEMLFFKIRQEQVRRYNECEKKNEKKISQRKVITNKGKKVRILEDEQGNPWTWVYGEGEGVVTVEEKWRKIHEKQLESAIKAVLVEEEKMVREQPKKIERNSSRQHGEMIVVKKSSRSPSSSPNGSPPNHSPINQMKISPDISPVHKRKEAGAATNNHTSQNRKQRVPIQPPTKAQNEVKVIKATLSQQKIEVEKPKQAPKPSPKPRSNVHSNHEIVEKLKQGESVRKVPGHQRKDVSVKKPSPSAPVPIRNHKENGNKENMENIYESFCPEQKQEDGVSNEEWQTQLNRFKEADRQRSIRARRASVEYRRQSSLASNPEKLRERFKQLAANNTSTDLKERPTLPPKPGNLRVKHPVSQPGKLSKPQNKAEVQEWFENKQIHNISQTDAFPPWLHGSISRPAAEELLENRKQGDFVIRISDKIWGYALSYKDVDKIKHFLIDASEEECYHFFGNDQIRHESLNELILYHQEEPISYNGEKLKNWIGQKDLRNPDYSDFECTDTRL